MRTLLTKEELMKYDFGALVKSLNDENRRIDLQIDNVGNVNYFMDIELGYNVLKQNSPAYNFNITADTGNFKFPLTSYSDCQGLSQRQIIKRLKGFQMFIGA